MDGESDGTWKILKGMCVSLKGGPMVAKCGFEARGWVPSGLTARAIVCIPESEELPSSHGPTAHSKSQGDDLQSKRVWRNETSSSRLEGLTAAVVRIGCASLLGLLCLAQPQRAGAQGPPTPGSSDSPESGGRLADSVAPAATDDAAEPPVLSAMNAAAERPARLAIDPADGGAGQVKEIYLDRKRPMKQEIILEGMMSYGNYKIFASGYDEKVYTGGVEYDRHSWGRFLGSEMDYVAEILPFVLLDKPLKTNQFGSPSYPVNVNKAIREYVPGLGISPIGFRWQWRSAKKIRPFLEAKGGVLAFTKKVPATQATYVNFSLESATGIQVMMNPKWGLRLGVFGDFHFSNAFIVPSNPGLDVMNANLGLSYHF